LNSTAPAWLGSELGTLMCSVPQAVIAVATIAAANIKRTLAGRLIEGGIIIASP
jgi:hypothetical protein